MGALRQKANELVNQAFYGPLLQEMRQEQNNPLFGNGPGAQVFLRQLDQALIERMSGRGGTPLAEAIVRKLCNQESGVRTQ